MRRVGIVLYQNIRYAPFLQTYEKILKDIENIEYDVIYFNRMPELGEIDDESHISINWIKIGGNRQSVCEKLINAAYFPFVAKKVLNKKKYDFIIVLTTMPAVLLCNYLVKHYSGKYIVDIRDYTKEMSSLYFRFEKKIIDYSAKCIISSPGFLDFLPKHDYCMMHNLNSANSDEFKFKKRPVGERVIISYIGSIQYTEQCKKMINLVLNDDRFEFVFYGNEPKGTEVSEYIGNCNCDRIRMMGSFLPSDKEKIYCASDLIFNCYGNNSLLVQKAISNKYYDAAVYKKPLLVSPETIMSDLSSQYAFPIDLDLTESLTSLWEWYQNIDPVAFETYANSLITDADRENKKTIDTIKNTIYKNIEHRG